MQSRFPRRAIYALLIAISAACVQRGAPLLPVESAPAAWAAEPATMKSGYALGEERCGTAPLAFPKLPIGMRPGYCAGLVASEDDGLVFPRTLVQVPDTRFFVVADMGKGWSAGQGRLLLLDPEAPEGKRVKVLLTKLDLPHGLAVGIDRRIYASTADKIFRFDPLAAEPGATVEVILHNLPGLQPILADGTKIQDSDHPLKPFVFDKTGRIYVNIGAPTDNCIAKAPETKPCNAGEGPAPLAAIWVFTPPIGGIFLALKPNDANPPREIYARGLRNSMALAVHPQFPAEGYAFLQAENGRDLPDLLSPNEELNVLERGKHYGWPYCYDLTTESPEYRKFLGAKGPFQHLCANTAVYKQPYSLLPPHAAPLSMLYYQGNKFPELSGKLLVGLHGYRPTGSRVVFYDVDPKGFPPISDPPVSYHLSCAAEPTHVFQTQEKPQVAAARFDELIFDWHKVNGVRPRGAPVGMTVASDGAIWLAEDHNRSIIRIDVDASAAPAAPLRCDTRSEEQIKELVGYVAKDQQNRQRLSQVRTRLVEKHCVGCHADFNLKPEMSGAQKDETVMRFILGEDGWVYPGDPQAGRLHSRVWGTGAERIMPANGRELIDKEPGYKQVLQTLDLLMAKMVPGDRKRVRLGQQVALTLEGRTAPNCGSIPNNTIVVVVDKNPKEKPGFSRIYRPADLYLNGTCADNDGYYLPAKKLGDL
jgi:glucose/arabinose dehydrogenase